MNEEKMKHIKFVPMEEATAPRAGLHNIHIDSWWVVNDKDELLFYKPKGHCWGSPQCNPDEKTAKFLHKKLYPEFKTIQIPVVYVPESYSNF